MTLNSRVSADHPTIRDCMQSLESLADEVWRDGYPGLQDICLLLLEFFREHSKDEYTAIADIWPLFAEWRQLIEEYKREPVSATPEIINFLVQPGVKILLSADELQMLADQLSEGKIFAEASDAEFALAMDSGAVPINFAETQQKSIEEYEAFIWQVADQAAMDGFFGLQEACLLLAEAVNSLSHAGETEFKSEVSVTLAAWPEIIEAYKQNPGTVATEIINVLRRPCFQLPLSEEEFGMLEASLLESSGSAIEQSFTEISQSDPELSDSLDWQQDKEVVGDSGFFSAPRGQAREILEMLLLQTELVTKIVGNLSASDVNSAKEGLQGVEIGLERLGAAAETAGYKALTLVCARLNDNVHQLFLNIGEFTDERLNLLRECLNRISSYLSDSSSIIAGQQLVFLLSNEAWPMPLALPDATEILVQIRENDLDGIEEREEPSRKVTAAVEDVSLDLPNDVNRELLEILLQELPIQTRQFSEAVQRLNSGGGSEDVLVAQRIAHTLKGSANTVGINGVAFLTHHLEDILTACSKQERLPQGQLANALLIAADCLEGMSEALLGLGEPPNDTRSVLQDILD